jgi:hypothetical protein
VMSSVALAGPTPPRGFVGMSLLVAEPSTINLVDRLALASTRLSAKSRPHGKRRLTEKRG